MSGSRITEDYEQVLDWGPEGLGHVRLFKHKASGRLMIEKKVWLENDFGASAREIQILGERISGLPEEVSLASGRPSVYDPDTPLFAPGVPPPHVLYFDFSSVSLMSLVEKLKSQNKQLPDSAVLGCFGLLLGIGAFFEESLEFHKGVCLQNLLIIDGRLQLVNPYLMDGHIQQTLEVASREQDFVRPQKSQELQAYHSNLISEMLFDSCLVFLALASMKNDRNYYSQGFVESVTVSRDLQVAPPHPGDRLEVQRRAALVRQRSARVQRAEHHLLRHPRAHVS